jgi:hypothetical protein
MLLNGSSCLSNVAYADGLRAAGVASARSIAFLEAADAELLPQKAGIPQIMARNVARNGQRIPLPVAETSGGAAPVSLPCTDTARPPCH